MKKTLEQIEAERMSRRQALGRIGFLAGASAVAAMTSDELLRLVGREMQKRAGDNEIAETVAKEFQNVGMARADVVADVGDEEDIDVCPPPPVDGKMLLGWSGMYSCIGIGTPATGPLGAPGCIWTDCVRKKACFGSPPAMTDVWLPNLPNLPCGVLTGKPHILVTKPF
jgi:hypothetical protein